MKQLAWLLAPLALAACSVLSLHGGRQLVGAFEHPDIVEASGLAPSHYDADRFWVLNDKGNAPYLYALNTAGEHLGIIAPNIRDYDDWEDLDVATVDGIRYLVVADIGDNEGVRDSIRLHLVAEPQRVPAGDIAVVVPVQRTLEFSYPGGGRDAESLAIDGETFYIASKRTRPAELYRGSLAAGDELRELEYLGPITTLPKPSAAELAAAPETGVYAWQPTAMTFSEDGRFAAVLTTRYAYLYGRSGNQDWLSVLNQKPRRFALAESLDAEAIAFAGAPVFLTTTEKQFAQIFRFTP